MEDDTWLPEGERSYDDEGEGKSDDSADEQDSEEEPHEEEEQAAVLAALRCNRWTRRYRGCPQ